MALNAVVTGSFKLYKLKPASWHGPLPTDAVKVATFAFNDGLTKMMEDQLSLMTSDAGMLELDGPDFHHERMEGSLNRIIVGAILHGTPTLLAAGIYGCVLRQLRRHDKPAELVVSGRYSDRFVGLHAR